MQNMTESLSGRLTALQTEASARREVLRNEIESRQAERESLLAQIATLQAQLRDVDDHIALVKQDLMEQDADSQVSEEGAVVEALTSCYQQVLAFAAQFHLARSLAGMRQALLSADSSIETKLRDYRQFEESGKAIIQGLPEAHRAALLQAQEALRAEVAEYLELEAQEQQAARPISFYFDVVVALDSQNRKVAILVPIPEDFGDLAPHVHDVVRQLRDMVYDSVVVLTDLPGWSVDDLALYAWQGNTVIELVGDYSGTVPCADSVREALTKTIAASPLFEGIVAGIRVAESGIRVASEQSQRTVLPQVPLVDAEDIVEPGTPGDTQVDRQPSSTRALVAVPSPDGISAGAVEPVPEPEADWFSSLQLVPLSLDRDAERLRRLLIYLVAHGKVGGDAVSVAALADALAGKAGASIEEKDILGAARVLLTVGVLDGASGSLTKQSKVSINPLFLDEVQALVTRDLTPFWSELLKQSVSAGAVPAESDR